MENENEIASLVRKLEQDYTSGTTQISKYVDFSLHENIEKIDAYLNSKHTSGNTDSKGREKPFFNIVTAAVNIWYRATDIDRKDIRIKPTKSQDTIGALLANVHLQDWMRKSKFGKFLNDWGLCLARYGSAVIKFVESDGLLNVKVIPWNRLIVDAVDFDANPKIEKLYFTPAQLKQQTSYDQKVIEGLLEAHTTRKTMGGSNKDTNNEFIEVYEVHGLLPLEYLTGKEKDSDTYVQQMHVISFMASKAKGKFDDFTLYKGKEAKDPYMITHLIPEDGRSMAIGAVEHLFEAQWMTNHSVKAIKDQLDLASKLIFQTSDSNFVGLNALNSIDTGDILIHGDNKPLTQIANNSHDITSLQSFASQWKSLGNEITGISESMLGNNPPSGTAWRQTEALLQESHSLFEIMMENKGLDIEEMLREYVIPFLKKKMNTKDEVVATLADYDIRRIEGIYIKNQAIRQANNIVKEQILNGEIAQPQDLTQIEADIQNQLNQFGNNRFFKPSELDDKTWKEVFKDLEWDVEVEVTGENSNKQVALTTLTTVFKTIASLAGRPMSPDEKLVFNKILQETGVISPLEMSQTTPPTQPMNPVAPAVGKVGTGLEKLAEVAQK